MWCRTDRPARLRVRYGTTDALAGARERVSAPTSADADFTARLDLTGLPPGQRIVYEARFEGRGGELSEPVRGAFRTPARTPAPVRIVWGGDVCGQGWGIDEGHGGMRTFASMRAAEPDLFIHSGDLIYADAPIPETLRLDDGSTWRNLVEDGVGDVAQTLDQFRGRYRYNLRDAHLRAFNAEVPMVAQWDDHEVLNNWYPTEVLGSAGNDARYTEKQVSVLAARAKQAFFDYAPIRPAGGSGGAIRGRSIASSAAGRWPRCSCSTAAATAGRTPPTCSPRPVRRRRCWRRRSGPGSRRRWRAPPRRGRSSPAISRSAWSCPTGRCRKASPTPTRGRSAASTRSRRCSRRSSAAASATSCSSPPTCTTPPRTATTRRARPTPTSIRSGSSWPGRSTPARSARASLDATFGPEAVFTSVAPKPNRPPSDGLQFFGLVAIDPATRAATVTLHDREGRVLYTKVLEPAA